MRRILLLFYILLFSAFISSAGSKSINIWEGTHCKDVVKLTPYLADGDNNVAVIVCPGGSYFWLDRKTEGVGVAKWLQSKGISAFVLEYRVAGVFAFVTHHRVLARGNCFPDMLLDVQRALQIVREKALDFNINPNRIGVMGFSAGGHLAAMSGIFFDNNILHSQGIFPYVSLKPDFIAPIYPVVSMTHPSTHKRSRRGLLGEGHDISPQMMDSLSLERHVRHDMPPTFIMNCVDDPIVDYHNSILLDSAMNHVKAPHQYVQFATGGHGFGANPDKTSSEAIAWKELFICWLNNLFK
ncbi:MAG: alpha/beta hydrolase [Muribaculaceae bacterium]|nr:alpha/beta hydrolase [Muribaculaceae bacterium]